MFNRYPKLEMMKVSTSMLQTIKVGTRTDFEKHEGQEPYIDLSIHLTDNIRVKSIFTEETTAREVINALRDMANILENKIKL